jgi:hypothetical protein
MPRHSPFAVALSREEKDALRTQGRRYTSSYESVVRAKAILLAAEGLSNKTIGERLDMPRQVVSKWRKRFCAERLDGLRDRSRRGRPSSFFPSGRRGDQGDGL